MSNNECVRRELTTEVVVGVFIVVILFGLSYFTIILSAQTVFSKKFPLEVIFEDVMGLRDGDNVVLRGMPVGKVSALSLKPDGVHVVALLDNPVTIHEEYRMEIVSTSMLGGQHLQIEDGPTNNPALPSDTVFVGKKPHDLMADAAELVNKVRHELIEGGVIDNLKTVTEELKATTQKINRGEGTLARLLNDDTLYNDLSAAVADLRKVSADLEAGKGTLGKLLSDDAVYDDLKSTVASAKSIAERLDTGQGTLGKLLSADSKLHDDLSATMASLKDITGRIEAGEGAIGKLVTDDDLYERIDNILSEVEATVDDFRETAPITTFTSIFFGAF